MRSLLAAAAVAVLLLSGPALRQEAQAAGLTGSIGARAAAGDPLVQQVRKRGHAYGRRGHVNRGLHRGWRIGRGNPHRRR